MTEKQQGVVVELEAVIGATNALTIPNKVQATLMADLGPVASSIERYADMAAVVKVRNQDEAVAVSATCDEIAAAVKLVKEHDMLAKITAGLHGAHRRWTAFRDAFVVPLEASRKTMKQAVITFQEAERVKAEAEQRRLQSEADAKARAEQERLLKLAEQRKTPEKQAEYREAAAAVIAPKVVVEAPKAMKVSRVWVVKAVDEAAFFAALARDPTLRGYVTIDRTKLARSKAANVATEIAGVTFTQEVR